eukprot:3905229-Pleurochrysis_carterae.AAC.2
MQSEGMDYSTRRRAGIYYVWDPTKISVAGIEEVYASRVARVSIRVLDSGKGTRGIRLVHARMRQQSGKDRGDLECIDT